MDAAGIHAQPHHRPDASITLSTVQQEPARRCTRRTIHAVDDVVDMSRCRWVGGWRARDLMPKRPAKREHNPAEPKQVGLSDYGRRLIAEAKPVTANDGRPLPHGALLCHPAQ
jgi:hypothetical protein